MDRTGQILKLEREHHTQNLNQKLSQIKYENRQQALITGINIITTQVNANMQALIYGVPV